MLAGVPTGVFLNGHDLMIFRFLCSGLTFTTKRLLHGLHDLAKDDCSATLFFWPRLFRHFEPQALLQTWQFCHGQFSSHLSARFDTDIL